jgi:hypothetical protein
MAFAYNLDNQLCFFSENIAITMPDIDNMIIICSEIYYVIDDMLVIYDVYRKKVTKTDHIPGIKKLVSVVVRLFIIFENRITDYSNNQAYDINGVTDILSYQDNQIYFMRGNKLYSYNTYVNLERQLLANYNIKHAFSLNQNIQIIDENNMLCTTVDDYERNANGSIISIKKSDLTNAKIIEKCGTIDDHIVVRLYHFIIIICPDGQTTCLCDYNDEIKIIESNKRSILINDKHLVDISKNTSFHVEFEGTLNPQRQLKSARNI